MPGTSDPGLSRMTQPRTPSSHVARLGGEQKMALPDSMVTALHHLCSESVLLKLCRVP